MQAETKFKTKVQAALKTLPNCWYVKTQQLAIRGTPDLLICIKGLFVALELKRNDQEDADPLQTFTLHKIDAAGGIAYVVNPTNWPAIFEELKRLAV
jgi:hypothetical protein